MVAHQTAFRRQHRDLVRSDAGASPRSDRDAMIAGHDDHRAKLQAFGQVHGADRHLRLLGSDLVVQHAKAQARHFHSLAGAIKLRLGPHEDGHLSGAHILTAASLQPCANT